LKILIAMLAAVLVMLTATGCGGYADFTLPRLNTTGPAGPFHWVPEALPVIERGEMSDVLNPSVVLFKGVYWNLYSEYDGKAWHTASASSSDGVKWEKVARVISPDASGKEGTYIAANGTALVVEDEIFYWYETGYPLQIVLARSRDGRTWTRQPGVVIERGPYGSFDERAAADPYVIRVGEFFYMYYLGQDRSERQTLGVARSKDGVTWEKLRSNPVMKGAEGKFDENVGEPAVWNSGGSWWMLYTARARDERRRMGLAKSEDGITWVRVPDFVIEGDRTWNYAVICDPSVEPMPDGTLRVWFGGGSALKPDQGIEGQIGLGWLKPGPAPAPAE
jgi:sucrose-6-phosphate hydrolase SacC (GH32 family)